MAGENVNHNLPPYHPLLLVDAFSLPGIQHDMPRHLEKFLPKFDPEKKTQLKTM
jgi:hypothetical protein